LICRFWDQYYPGGSYNRNAKTKTATAKQSARVVAKPLTAKDSRQSQTAPRAAAAAGPTDEYEKIITDLTTQTSDLKLNIDQLEREREFYFGKLREIEVYIQAKLEVGADEHMQQCFSDIQAIMYKVLQVYCRQRMGLKLQKLINKIEILFLIY
jgi:RP/EB family microtubule-associated protein